MKGPLLALYSFFCFIIYWFFQFDSGGFQAARHPDEFLICNLLPKTMHALSLWNRKNIGLSWRCYHLKIVSLVWFITWLPAHCGLFTFILSYFLNINLWITKLGNDWCIIGKKIANKCITLKIFYANKMVASGSQYMVQDFFSPYKILYYCF